MAAMDPVIRSKSWVVGWGGKYLEDDDDGGLGSHALRYEMKVRSTLVRDSLF